MAYSGGGAKTFSLRAKTKTKWWAMGQKQTLHNYCIVLLHATDLKDKMKRFNRSPN